jgi:hypothetical protein
MPAIKPGAGPDLSRDLTRLITHESAMKFMVETEGGSLGFLYASRFHSPEYGRCSRFEFIGSGKDAVTDGGVERTGSGGSAGRRFGATG